MDWTSLLCKGTIVSPHGTRCTDLLCDYLKSLNYLASSSLWFFSPSLTGQGQTARSTSMTQTTLPREVGLHNDHASSSSNQDVTHLSDVGQTGKSNELLSHGFIGKYLNPSPQQPAPRAAVQPILVTVASMLNMTHSYPESVVSSMYSPF